MVIIALHNYALLVTSQASFFLTSCYYLEAYCNDFDLMMAKLSHQINRHSDAESEQILKKRLSDAIKFHTQISR